MLDREDELDAAASARIRLAAGFLAFPRSQPEARVHWQRSTELFRRLGETRLLAYSLAVGSATYLSEQEQLRAWRCRSTTRRSRWVAASAGRP